MKIYDRGADRGAYRYCIIAPVGTYRTNELAETEVGPRRITTVGARSFNDPPVCYYYIKHEDPSAPEELTTEQKLRRENAALKLRHEPTPEQRARQLAWGARLRAGKERKRQARLAEEQKQYDEFDRRAREKREREAAESAALRTKKPK